jgi:hypothetical protein
VWQDPILTSSRALHLRCFLFVCVRTHRLLFGPHSSLSLLSRSSSVSPFTYLQGMNAISGCFLYCMTEMDAFYAFTTFITEKTPLYWVSSHIGANAGCKLVDAVLAVVDPTLAAHLAATTPGAYVYAFHCVSGFCSTIRPLSEVLKLWDFLLAFGPHFNVTPRTADSSRNICIADGSMRLHPHALSPLRVCGSRFSASLLKSF